MFILHDYNVSSDDKWLTVDVEINPQFTKSYIKTFRISATGDFGDDDTSAKLFDTIIASTVDEYTGEAVVFDDVTKVQKVRFKIDLSDKSIMVKPYYLQVLAYKADDEATTCAYVNPLTAVTFNKYPIYRVIACAAHEMDSCNAPRGFIDYLMRLKALEASIAIGDTDSINAYHEWLILHGSTRYVCGQNIVTNTGCGCNR